LEIGFSVERCSRA